VKIFAPPPLPPYTVDKIVPCEPSTLSLLLAGENRSQAELGDKRL